MERCDENGRDPMQAALDEGFSEAADMIRSERARREGLDFLGVTAEPRGTSSAPRI